MLCCLFRLQHRKRQETKPKTAQTQVDLSLINTSEPEFVCYFGVSLSIVFSVSFKPVILFNFIINFGCFYFPYYRTKLQI